MRVVIIDEPLVRVVRLFELAGHPQPLGPYPTGEQLIAIEFDRLGGGLIRGGHVIAIHRPPRRLGL